MVCVTGGQEEGRTTSGPDPATVRTPRPLYSGFLKSRAAVLPVVAGDFCPQKVRSAERVVRVILTHTMKLYGKEPLRMY